MNARKVSVCKTKGWVVNPATGRCWLEKKEGYERSLVTSKWVRIPKSRKSRMKKS